MNPTPNCPWCGSTEVVSRNFARKAGGIAGAIAGAAAALNIPRSGSSLSVLSGTVVGALLGGAAGCTTGAVLGSAIDENVLENHECTKCGNSFSRPGPV